MDNNLLQSEQDHNVLDVLLWLKQKTQPTIAELIQESGHKLKILPTWWKSLLKSTRKHTIEEVAPSTVLTWQEIFHIWSMDLLCKTLPEPVGSSALHWYIDEVIPAWQEPIQQILEYPHKSELPLLVVRLFDNIIVSASGLKKALHLITGKKLTELTSLPVIVIAYNMTGYWIHILKRWQQHAENQNRLQKRFMDQSR